jgi:hypothetical protein
MKGPHFRSYNVYIQWVNKLLNTEYEYNPSKHSRTSKVHIHAYSPYTERRACVRSHTTHTHTQCHNDEIEFFMIIILFHRVVYSSDIVLKDLDPSKLVTASTSY